MCTRLPAAMQDRTEHLYCPCGFVVWVFCALEFLPTCKSRLLMFPSGRALPGCRVLCHPP